MDEKDILLQFKDYIDLTKQTMNAMMDRFSLYDKRIENLETMVTKMSDVILSLKNENEVLAQGFNDIKEEIEK